jgi:hypothetical protein
MLAAGGYSQRSATSGSTRKTRSAGTNVAASATPISSAETDTRVSGSLDCYAAGSRRNRRNRH